MSLRLRHLRLRAETGRGRFGADLPLQDGLVILRADNSRGKSTAAQSVLFALGLERMIATQPTNALTSAMRESLIYDEESMGETPVLASWVQLQVEGDAGAATLTRWVKHDELDPGLIRVTHGPAITSSEEYASEDFYVGRAGAAANPRGFHRWLAGFLGWEMPELPATGGRIALLYMEQIFPLLFVEQRRGWGGIQAQMPYFSGVSDVRRRAIEFLLDLDVGEIETERQRLKADEAMLQDEWSAAVTGFTETLTGHGLVPIRLPETLTVVWPPEHPPEIAESRNGSWVGIDDLLDELKAEHKRLESEEIPVIDGQAGQTEEELGKALADADALRQAGVLMREDLLRDRQELRAVASRLGALRQDLREHQDIVTLQRLGSSDLARLHGDCPVCHQALPASLIGEESQALVLSPEDSVAYIRQQIELFEVMDRDGKRALGAKSERWASLRARAAEVRSQVRSLRTTLVAPNGTPSAAVIARRIRLTERVDRLEGVSERFLGLLGELDRLAERGRAVRAAIAELPVDRLSKTDTAKLDYLESAFIEQLHEYEFGSFSDERLSISREDYLPRREQFDLQADISASDSIRVIWAYLLGLMEVGTKWQTNHPGVLVFDEPRQQSTKTVSFEALLRRAAKDSSQRQVIFATSEEPESLKEMLEGVPHVLQEVEGYVLKPVADTG